MSLFKKFATKRNKLVLLQAAFKDELKDDFLIQKQNVVTEYLSENKAYAFLGDKKELCFGGLTTFFKTLAQNATRDYQVDLASFVTEKLTLNDVIDSFTRAIYFVQGPIYSAKAKADQEQFKTLEALLEQPSKENEEALKKALILAEATNFARNLQMTPPNICNSEYLAEVVKKDLAQYKNLKVTVLNKKQIEEEKMGLLLSVNRGSVYEPRVVVIEYIGDPKTKEKTAMIGKGITFDSGGYSLKGPRHMLGMKFDMSGSVIVASTMKAIAQLKPKKNVAAIMCITDNRINGDASLPDSVWTAMNGKTVEINNTDAEGRLVMADGLTYGARVLKATRLIDVATLTGAILIALGTTYTGIWATSDKAWDEFSTAAHKAHELVWRMPFDKAFSKNIKASKVADLKNTDLSGNAGSCSAAMFLKEFTDGVEYIHCDVAGTAEIDEMAQGVLIKTLAELSLI
ncbi:M17 family metallopeptidase [Mycoplasmopsis adleri]|uniref:M17 family metallopeptidase n=1 Tax=Mycoplasmopsis adleri TaxID=51362 RepID=UPI0038732AE4